MIVDELSSALEFNETNCSTYSIEGNVITWNISQIDSKSSVTFYLIVNVVSNGTVSNGVNVTSKENDTEVTNKTEEIELVPAADLEITKEVQGGVDKVDVGETVTYIIVVKNNGPSNATDVVVVENLSSLVEFVSADVTDGAF